MTASMRATSLSWRLLRLALAFALVGAFDAADLPVPVATAGPLAFALAAATTLASADAGAFNAAIGSPLGALLLLAAVGGRASRLWNGAGAGVLAADGASATASVGGVLGATGVLATTVGAAGRMATLG